MIITKIQTINFSFSLKQESSFWAITLQPRKLCFRIDFLWVAAFLALNLAYIWYNFAQIFPNAYKFDHNLACAFQQHELWTILKSCILSPFSSSISLLSSSNFANTQNLSCHQVLQDIFEHLPVSKDRIACSSTLHLHLFQHFFQRNNVHFI